MKKSGTIILNHKRKQKATMDLLCLLAFPKFSFTREILILISFFFFSFPLKSQHLKVGLEKIVLDVPMDVPMWGYLPARNSALSLDPLYAKIFVFDDGSNRMALVQLDLGRTFGETYMDQVREEVAASTGIKEVIFTATHTHSGPAVLDTYPEGKPPAWEQKILKDIPVAIEKAANNMFEAELGYGVGASDIGFNRRYIQMDGSVKMLWANPTKISTYPLDPEVQVLRVDDQEGNTKALIVGHACHPVVFGPDNAGLSADFPGAMAAYASKHIPGNPMISFFQGGCGDINPYMDKRRINENGVEVMQKVGEELAKEVVRINRQIETQDQAASLQIQVDTFNFADRMDPSKMYETKLTTFVLNGQYGFVGYPGEPFVEFQRELKRLAGIPAFFMGYTNGYFRYFPTIRASVEGGYGARGPVAVVEVGAGERLLYRGLNRIYTMTGKLKTKQGE